MTTWQSPTIYILKVITSKCFGKNIDFHASVFRELENAIDTAIEFIREDIEVFEGENANDVFSKYYVDSNKLKQRIRNTRRDGDSYVDITIGSTAYSICIVKDEPDEG